MRKENTWIRPLLVMVVISALSVLVTLNRTKLETKQLVFDKQTLQDEVDSLKMELFILNVEIGRHEVTRDYFFGKYPKLQLDYENYLNHETE
jgi:hypothetical protein